MAGLQAYILLGTLLWIAFYLFVYFSLYVPSSSHASIQNNEKITDKLEQNNRIVNKNSVNHIDQVSVDPFLSPYCQSLITGCILYSSSVDIIIYYNQNQGQNDKLSLLQTASIYHIILLT